MAKKILVIDDEPSILTLVESILAANGYEVFTASDGQEGYDKAQQYIPDLILLDVVMPKMDGSAMAEALRMNPVTEDIPVIFLTGLVEKDEEERASQQIGGNIFIAKPFTPGELLSMIGNVFEDPSKII